MDWDGTGRARIQDGMGGGRMGRDNRGDGT